MEHRVDVEEVTRRGNQVNGGKPQVLALSRAQQEQSKPGNCSQQIAKEQEVLGGEGPRLMITPELSLLVHKADITDAHTLELRVINGRRSRPLPDADSYYQELLPVRDAGWDGHDLL